MPGAVTLMFDTSQERVLAADCLKAIDRKAELFVSVAINTPENLPDSEADPPGVIFSAELTCVNELALCLNTAAEGSTTPPLTLTVKSNSILYLIPEIIGIVHPANLVFSSVVLAVNPVAAPVNVSNGRALEFIELESSFVT